MKIHTAIRGYLHQSINTDESWCYKENQKKHLIYTESRPEINLIFEWLERDTQQFVQIKYSTSSYIDLTTHTPRKPGGWPAYYRTASLTVLSILVTTYRMFSVLLSFFFRFLRYPCKLYFGFTVPFLKTTG